MFRGDDIFLVLQFCTLLEDGSCCCCFSFFRMLWLVNVCLMLDLVWSLTLIVFLFNILLRGWTRKQTSGNWLLHALKHLKIMAITSFDIFFLLQLAHFVHISTKVKVWSLCNETNCLYLRNTTFD